MVFYSESGLPKIANVSEIRYYNRKPYDRKFICGECTIDAGTEFVLKPFFYNRKSPILLLSNPASSSMGYCIVPNQRDMVNVKDINGNPKYAMCLLNSETFFECFIPCLNIDGIGWDDWRKRSDLVRNVTDYIMEPSRKDRVLSHMMHHEDAEIRSYVKEGSDGVIRLDKSYLHFAFIEKLEWLISDIKVI